MAIATVSSTAVSICDDPIEIVVHQDKKIEKQKAAMELLANNPEVFEDGLLKDVKLDMPFLTSTEAAIVVEAANVIQSWKEFVMFIFQIYPHDRTVLNMKRVEHLWPHVLRLQGKDPESN